MSIRPILRWPDPVLSRVAAPVTGDVSELVTDLLDTMYAAPGRGLAAPQLGVLHRVFVMDVAWKDGPPDPHVCINPQITDRALDRVEGTEGCLSIPGVTAEVARAPWIALSWTDQDGIRRHARLDGFAARCAQHEIDHLDGRVTLDRVSAEQRADLEARYHGA